MQPFRRVSLVSYRAFGSFQHNRMVAYNTKLKHLICKCCSGKQGKALTFGLKQNDFEYLRHPIHGSAVEKF